MTERLDGGLRPPREARHAQNPLDQNKGEPYYQYAREEVIETIVRRGITARRALELGCSSGATGRRLKALLAIEEYLGIEVFEPAAEQARSALDRVLVADVERSSFTELGLRAESFDLVLALDVLEHLYNPWDVLADLVRLLVPDGHAILSVPNVRNITVLAALAKGQWNYEAAGLLDATHVRFFTLDSATRLVRGAGLELVAAHATLNPPLNEDELKEVGNSLSNDHLVLTDLSKDAMKEFFTYQFILVARKPAGRT